MQTLGDEADTLSKAKNGITVLPIASANSGEEQNASANDAETASVQLTSEDDAHFRFGGSADAEITGDAGSEAFADPGGGTSAASYEFLATSGELLRINYTTKSDFDPGQIIYTITVSNGTKHQEIFLGANGSNSIEVDLTKGLNIISFLVEQPETLFL